MKSFKNAAGLPTTVSPSNPLPVTVGGKVTAQDGAKVVISGPYADAPISALGGSIYGNNPDGSAVGVPVSGVSLLDGTQWRPWPGNVSGGYMQGAGANGAAVVGNPNLVGGFDGTNTRTLLTGTNGAVRIGMGGNTAAASAAANDATTGANLLGAGVLGQFLSTPTTYTTGQFGTLLMNPRGSLALSHAGTTGASATVSTGIQMSMGMDGNSRPLATAGFVMDGTTFRPAPGDATGGAYVQERERAILFSESAGAVAANATVNGTTRDSSVAAAAGGTYSQFLNFSAMARPNAADPAGTLRVEGSDDGTNWLVVGSSSATAGVVTVVTVPMFYRYHRASYVNSGTAATNVVLRSRMSA